jgi:hypothetical protein
MTENSRPKLKIHGVKSNLKIHQANTKIHRENIQHENSHSKHQTTQQPNSNTEPFYLPSHEHSQNPALLPQQ